VRPTESIDHLQFVSGTFGPLEPGTKVQVPLWLALTLRDGNKVRIVIPDWLRKDNLDECIAFEEARREEFFGLPFHFAEIAEALLRDAEQDFAAERESPKTVSHLIQKVISVRERKIKKLTATLLQRIKEADNEVELPITNLGALEVSMLREGLLRVRNVPFLSLHVLIYTSLSPPNATSPNKLRQVLDEIVPIREAQRAATDQRERDDRRGRREGRRPAPTVAAAVSSASAAPADALVEMSAAERMQARREEMMRKRSAMLARRAAGNAGGDAGGGDVDENRDGGGVGID
jgi:GINS complex subunit 2